MGLLVVPAESRTRESTAVRNGAIFIRPHGNGQKGEGESRRTEIKRERTREKDGRREGGSG